MENARHEAIKAAYGEFWEKVKDYVRDCGVLIDPLTSADVDEYISNNKENLEFIDTDIYRPISLNGIERNNGWTRVEEGLPTNYDIEYFCLHKCGRIIIRGFYEYLGWGEFNSEILDQSDITHYQPIDSPKPPIF
ncbi:hypothetical protein CMU75_09020 [Elizabethkingia anophelis]|nr:hypothetical protein [Elizabethkingia anophelis]MDV3653258.1 hypothetical protein [Elizabethkingia anophelis]